MAESLGIENEHTTDLNLTGLTSPLVGFEILRVSPFELESDALTHDSDRVDSINERFGIGSEKVSMIFGDHRLGLLVAEGRICMLLVLPADTDSFISSTSCGSR
jgi:hypothetical protein